MLSLDGCRVFVFENVWAALNTALASDGNAMKIGSLPAVSLYVTE